MALDPIYTHPTEGEINYATLVRLASDEGISVDDYIIDYNVVIKDVDDSKKEEVTATTESAPVVTDKDKALELESKRAGYISDLNSGTYGNSNIAQREITLYDRDLKKIYRSMDMDINMPESLIDKTEEKVAEYLFKKFPWLKTEETGMRNALEINIPGQEQIELDLSPIFLSGRKEAISVIEKIKEYDKSVKAEAYVMNMVSTTALTLDENDNQDYINGVLEGSGYEIKQDITLDETIGFEGKMVKNYSIYKDGEVVLENASSSNVQKYLNNNFDTSQYDTVKKNTYEATSLYLQDTKRALEAEKVIIEKDDSIGTTYLKERYVEDIITAYNALTGGVDLTEEEEKEIRDTFENVSDGAVSHGGRKYGGSLQAVNDSVAEALKQLPDELRAKIDVIGLEGLRNSGLDNLRKQTLSNREETIADRILKASGNQDLIKLGQRFAIGDKILFDKNVAKKIKLTSEIYEKRLNGVVVDQGKTLVENSPEGTEFSVTYNGSTPIFSLTNDRDLSKEENKAFEDTREKMLKLQEDFVNLQYDRTATITNIRQDIQEFYTDSKIDGDVLRSSMKSYELGTLLRKDVNDAFASVLLTVPTLLRSDYALDAQKELNDKNQFYETMGTYDDNDSFTNFFFRTLGQQSANIVLAIGTGAVGSGLGFSTAMTSNAIGGLFGATSGTQTFRDLKLTQEIVGTADKQAKLAEQAYKNGNIDLYSYTSIMRDINKARAMTEISDGQIMSSALANGIIEGTVTRFLGTAPNTIKLLKDFKTPMQLTTVAKNLYRGNFSKVADMIGKPLLFRGGGEILEEELIYVGQQTVTEYGILDRELDLSAWDDTALSTIITLGATQSPGVAYSGIVNYNATKEFEQTINKLRLSNNDLSTIIQQSDVDTKTKELILTDIAENLKEQGLSLDRLAVDVLSKGAVDIKRIVGTELIKNSLLAKAGVTVDMSDVQKAEMINLYKKNLSKEDAKLFDIQLNVLEKQINKIRDKAPDYSKAEKSLGNIFTINNDILEKNDPDYKKKSKQDKIVQIINTVRQDIIKGYIDDGKSNPEIVDFVENERDFSKSKKGRKYNKKQKEALYGEIGRMQALSQSRGFSTNLNVNKSVDNIFGNDVKNISVKQFNNESELIELLENAGLKKNTPSFTNAFNKLNEGNAYGLVVGKSIITQNEKGVLEDLEKGQIRAGTVVLHEISHVIDDARMKNPESRKIYADNLFKAAENSKNRRVSLAHLEVIGMLNKIYPDLTFEDSDKYRDEYTKYMQETLFAYEDEAQIEKEESFFTKIFNSTDAANLNTPEKALNYLAANNAAFRSGKLSRASRKAVENYDPDVLEVKDSDKSTVNKLAVEYKNKPEAFDRNKYTDFFTQYQSVAVDAMGYNVAKGDILANEAEQFVAGEFKSIMNTFDPSIAAFTTHVVNTFKNRRANKFYKQEFAPKDISLTRIGKGFDVIDQNSNESLDDREAREDAETTSKIDPRKFKAVIPKIKQIESAVDITVEKDIAPFKADFKAISAKYGTKVASILYNIEASKLQKNANLTYAKKISKDGIPENSEAGRIQEDFDTRNDQEVRKFLKLLPPENVTSKESEVGAQGERIAVSKDVQGRSLGLPGRVLDFFYDEKTGERSSGLTSQPFIRKLKSKYGANTKITNETIKELQDAMGITPARQLNRYDRNIGTFLAGVAKLKGAIITNTVARVKVDKMDTSKSSKPKKQIIADMGSGRSSIQFSDKVKVIFSKALFEQETKGIDNLLKSYKLDGTFKFKTREDIDIYVKEVKKNLLPLMPKDFWFGTPNKKGNYGTVFTASSKILGTTDASKALYKDYYVSEMKKLAQDKTQKYGDKIEGVSDFTVAGYDTLFKTVDIIKAKTKSGDIAKFNKKVAAIHQAMWYRFKKSIKNNKNSARVIGNYLKITGSDTKHWHKLGAQFVGYSSKITGARFEYEHAMPATSAYLYLLDVALSNDNSFERAYDYVIDNYKLISLDKAMDKKLIAVGLRSRMPVGWNLLDNKWYDRYFSPLVVTQDGGINPAGLIGIDGKNFQETYRINANGSPYIRGTFKSNANTEVAKNNIADKAMKNARSPKYSEKIKKARVFDFDDTLAQTKSNVLYTMPDGTTGKMDAATFARDAGKMEAEGAKWDFSEFSKVMDGKKGPLFDVAKKIQDARGSEDIFVLTARPQDAAGPIKEFLASLGLNIPLANITGLSDGRPQAKADWMLGKFAEGYNDFYFTDDMLKNVKAVKDVLSVLDVKSKVQQARMKFSEKLSIDFNDMIERNKGVASKATFSDALARRRGQNQKRYAFFIPPSADDFRGLTMYTFAGKGKQGEMDQDFFDKALIKPYMRGVGAMELSKQQIKNDYRSLIKNYPKVRKRLKKKLGETKYNVDEAIRIFLWNEAGFTIPGLSKTDQKEVVKLVSEDAALTEFADGVKLVTRQDTYVEPNEFWDAGTILGDLNRVGREVNRKEYLAEFIENADIIFSPENLNKVQALYGFRVRESIENSLYRMKTGSNKVAGTGRIVEKWNEWVNNSVGAIMFFNRRSALLQMLSSVNFVNWSDNNPAKAALALANQPQYWKDVITLFNSDKLKQRRSGLEGDIQESEIAQASKKGGMNGVISYLLKIGFTPTQIADSIAISTGGATFYRNRINTYKKDGYEQAEAEKKAFSDFSEISDETQQSADPMLISGQQSSILGRLVLAFQNTPMQYTRLIKKAGQDLINGRGSKKTNISKILYYGFVQNLIFNTLQNALFALIPGFDDEDEDFATDKEKAKYEERKQREEDSKTERIINGMIDSIVRGSGLAGAVAVTVKNTIREYLEYQDKPVFSREKGDIILAALQISPPIGSKARKINAALQTQQYEKDVISERGFDVMIDGKFQLSPAYNMLGSSTAAFFNLPLDRAVDEINSITEALDDRNTKWQRIALALGWRSWDTGVRIEEHELLKIKAKKERKEQGKIKSKETRKINKSLSRDAMYYRNKVLGAIPDSVRIRVVAEQERKFPGIPLPSYKVQLLEEKYLDLK